METEADAAGAGAGDVVPQMRYARLWKALTSGAVPSRAVDVAGWYGAAQHAVGAALHEAQMDGLLDEVEGEDGQTLTQHAA